MPIRVPIKVLHEAEDHIVTLETITSEVYRGKLIEAEDNMRFLILPDMLKNAPMFKKQTGKGGTAGNKRLQTKSIVWFVLRATFLGLIYFEIGAIRSALQFHV